MIPSPLNRRVLLVLLGALAVALPADSVRADEAPRAVVEGFYRTLLDVMKQGAALGFQGRAERIRSAFDTAFNAPLMARVVVGPAWQAAAAEQQAAAVEAFTRYSVANYAANFKEFGGERLEVLGERTIPAGTVVDTRIVPPGEPPVPINYLLRPVPGGWKIADVFLNGTISELATRRSDFARTMQDQGIPGLVARLDAKRQELAAAN
ncbi:ABC transporter substrate-binding protein [Azospirillum sp. sgz301742]